MNQELNFFEYPDGRLDTLNAAKYLGLSLKTLAMMRSRGTGPKFIKPGRIFYYKGDLIEWLVSKGKMTTTAFYRSREKPPEKQEERPCTRIVL